MIKSGFILLEQGSKDIGGQAVSIFHNLEWLPTGQRANKLSQSHLRFHQHLHDHLLILKLQLKLAITACVPKSCHSAQQKVRSSDDSSKHFNRLGTLPAERILVTNGSTKHIKKSKNLLSKRSKKKPKSQSSHILGATAAKKDS